MLKKNKALKIIFIILTIIIIIGNTVYGETNKSIIEEKDEIITTEIIRKREYKSPAPGTTVAPVANNDSSSDNGIDGGDILDGVAGILLLPAKAIIILLGEAIRIILGFFAGENGEGLTIQKILFNDLPLTDINFFDFNSGNMEPAVKAIRQNVATWYIGVRNIAAVLLVIVAIYVGLRMAISTVAEEKAKYKQMLIDWLTSLCLLFILHYIMIIVIQLNNTLVKTIGDSVRDSNLNDVAREFANQAWASINFSKGMAEALAFLLLELMTLIYLISYIKRMITIGFLIIIAPLVTVTYSIDKMGDGRSQALNAWFKEFAYNILLQPFQCVTYLALCASSLDLLDSNDLKSAVLAICMLIFLKTSEEIIKHIFNFQAKSMADTFANAALMTAAVKGFTNVGKNIADGGNDSGQRPSEKMQSENRRALPVNNSGDRGIRMHDSTASDAVAVGAGAAAFDSADEDRAYNRQAQENNSGNNSSNNTDNSERNSDNKNKERRKKASAILSKAGKIAIGANTIFLGTALGAVAGAATGNFSAALTGGVSGYGLSKGIKARGMNAIINREIKNRTASALFDYKGQRGDISDKQLIEEGMQLLDGTRDAKTDSERELRDSLMEMYDRRIRLGDDEEDGLENTKKAMQEILDRERIKRERNAQSSGTNNSPDGKTNKQTTNGQNGAVPQDNSTQSEKKSSRFTVPTDSSTSSSNTSSSGTVNTESKNYEEHSDQNREVKDNDEAPTPIEGEQSIGFKENPRASETASTPTKKESESKNESEQDSTKRDYISEGKDEHREESAKNDENTDTKKGDD